MKKILITAAALAAASATAASAADLAVRPAYPAKSVPVVEVPPVAPTWAGPYIGLHAGYLSSGGEYTFPGSAEFHFVDPKGFAGGLMAGYSMQSGRFVYGVEADVAFVSAKETLDTALPPDTAATQLSTEINWNSHLRGRLGYAFDRVMVFAAGGLAIADVEHSAIDNTAGATATWSTTRLGWSLGTGLEFRATARSSVRLEYIYDNYGTDGLGGACPYHRDHLRHHGADDGADLAADATRPARTISPALNRRIARRGRINDGEPMRMRGRSPHAHRLRSRTIRAEHPMRRSSLVLAAAAALTSAPLSSPAHAFTTGAAHGLAPAADGLAAVETVGCWGYGWRGWAWYPGLIRCAGRVYGPPPAAYVVEAAPVYAPPPVYHVPGSCWVTTDPERNLGHWRAC